MRQFFLVPTSYVLVKKQEKYFSVTHFLLKACIYMNEKVNDPGFSYVALWMLAVQFMACVFKCINPFKLNEISHYYQLDQSISVLRVVEWYFSFLFKF